MPETAIWLPNGTKASEYADLGIKNAWVNEAANPKTQTMFDYRKQFNAVNMGVWSFPYNKCTLPGGVWTPERVSMQDEPVMHGITPAVYAQQVKVFAELAPFVPMVGNFEGDKFSIYKPSADEKDFTRLSTWKNVNLQQGPYFQNLPKDFIAFLDFFIFNRVRYSQTVPQTMTWYTFDNIFAGIDFILQYHDEVGVFIEASNQCIDPNSRAPNRGEMRAEAIGGLIWGAKYWAFFGERPGNKPANWETYGTKDDAIPPALRQEIKVLCDFVNQFESILDDRTGSVREVNTPFIGRKWPSGHELVLNLSKRQSTTTAGSIFEAYEARFYGPDGTVLWSDATTSPINQYVSPPIVPTPAPIPPTQTVPKADYDKLMIDYQTTQARMASLQGTIETLLSDHNINVAAISDLKTRLAGREAQLSEIVTAIATLLRHSQDSTTPGDPHA